VIAVVQVFILAAVTALWLTAAIVQLIDKDSR